jgi:hypothetical protein
MKLIKIKNHYYLLSNEEPKLFDTVVCPVIKNNTWDGKSFEVDNLTSDLMSLYPNEFKAVKTIVASTEGLIGVPKIDVLELIKFGIKKESLVDRLADDFCKEHLPHVDTTGHWLGFFKGWEKHAELNEGKEYTYQNMIDLVSQLMDYTREGRIILGHDEREPFEFVDIFIDGLPKKDEITEWEVIVDTEKDNSLILTGGYIQILRVTKEKFIIWGTYDNWKEKNEPRLRFDYDEQVKRCYSKSFDFYCCGRWDENEL